MVGPGAAALAGLKPGGCRCHIAHARASADTETADEADAIGRQTVLDLQADEMVESLDLTPGSDLGDASDEEKRTRRRLLDMAREAENCSAPGMKS